MAFVPFLVTVFCLLHCTAFTSAATLEGRGLGIWTISNFRAFTPAPGTNGVSSVSFEFPNGTATTTACTHHFVTSAGKSVVDSDSYYSCNDTTVSFKYGGSWLAIATLLPNKDGSITTNFGNVTTAQQCYSTSVQNPYLNGQTCELATSESSIPLLSSTTVSNTAAMPASMKARIAQAMSDISTQPVSAYKGLRKRQVVTYSNCTAVSRRDVNLKSRQLVNANPGSISISNVVAHNYLPFPGANSDISFQLTALGMTTTCSASVGVNQGSVANVAHSCAFSNAKFNWTSLTTLNTAVTLDNPDGTTTTYAANLSLTNGFCIAQQSNGQNVWSAGNRCQSSTGTITAPINSIVNLAAGLVPSLSGPSTTSMSALPLLPLPTAAAASSSSVAASPASPTMSTPTSPSTLPYTGGSSDVGARYLVSRQHLANMVVLLLALLAAMI